MTNRSWMAGGVLVASALVGVVLAFKGGNENRHEPSRPVEDHAERPWFFRKGRAVLPAARSTSEQSADSANADAEVSIRGLTFDAVTLDPVVTEVRLLSGEEGLDAVWSDDQGRFQFPPTAIPRRARVAARAEGYATALTDLGGNSSELLVALDRSATMSGRVVNQEGVGIEGAWVVASDTSNATWPLPQSSRVTTDPDGRFELVDVPPGRILVEAGGDGFSTGEAAFAAVGPDRSFDNVEIRLKRAGIVRGKVLFRGEPVPDADVSLRLQYQSRAAHSKSDEEGRYAFEDAPTGKIFVAARHAEYGIVAAERTIAGSDEVELDLDLQTGLMLAGTVLDPDGSPLQGVTVIIATGYLRTKRPGQLAEIPAQAFQGIGPFTRARTDASGHFETSAIASDSATIRIMHDPFRQVEIPDIPLPARDVEIRLERGASIAGVVLAADGRPWTGTGGSVRAVQVEGHQAGSAAPSKGRFEIEGLSEGEWDVSFHHPLDGDSNEARVRASAGRPSEVTLALSAGATAMGRVMSRGKPVAGARVGPANSYDRSVALSYDKAVRSGVDGRFSVSISPGLRAVSAYHPEYRGAYREEIAIAPGETIDIGVLEMIPGPGSPDIPKVAGVGIYFARSGRNLEITYVIENGGSARAGIKKNDVLLAVDGTTTDGIEDAAVTKMLEGEPYSKVVLRIRKQGSQPEDIEVVRIPELVQARMNDNNSFSITWTMPAASP